jgi:hypothetical protein
VGVHTSKQPLISAAAAAETSCFPCARMVKNEKINHERKKIPHREINSRE